MATLYPASSLTLKWQGPSCVCFQLTFRTMGLSSEQRIWYFKPNTKYYLNISLSFFRSIINLYLPFNGFFQITYELIKTC